MHIFKSSHPAIAAYHEALRGYAAQKVRHEGALRSAFQNLLADTARVVHWQLIPDLSDRRRAIRPDGTLRDDFFIERGYWEAKDTDDVLEAEIKKKITKGYPLQNTIFEDTRRAVLFQDGRRIEEYDLEDNKAIASLLTAFYGHVEPTLEKFEKAIDEFKERVPELATGLIAIIKAARKVNPKFIKAFDDFFELCRLSLNPNLRVEAVEEMLVQHLLTERLIRRIFDNPDFNSRNVIAVEVEGVIRALVSKSFNRDEFLKSLDRFYVAIEAAAQTVQSFSEKQYFLNIVYERFFQGFSVKSADTHGIVYTPQPIVDFMCQSVEDVLRDEFDASLGEHSVQVLDPCTGTGNFVVNLLHRLPKRHLAAAYGQQFFANEVMLMPYYIAALNIEHAFFELAGTYEAFEGLCFVDTLDMAKTLLALTEANTQRVTKENDAPITVVIGNPPYNAAQVNENDNNKNRKYRFIDDRIHGTYAADSTATLKNKLYDPYVRFFRWATDRLEGRDGIVCFVTNNSFIEETAFDGMRRRLHREFSRVYHLDLQGNVRSDPEKSGTAYNVFGVQVGIGITIAIRHKSHDAHRVFYAAVSPELRREEKLQWLTDARSVTAVKWREIFPDDRHQWITSAGAVGFKKLTPLGSKSAKGSDTEFGHNVIFKTYSLGASTNRDALAYDFQRQRLENNVAEFCDTYNAEVDRWSRLKRKRNVDDFVDYDALKWSSTLKSQLKRGRIAQFDRKNVRESLYRPFTKRYLYYDDVVVDRPALFDAMLPDRAAEKENLLICTPTLGNRGGWAVLMTNLIPNLNLTSIDGFQTFPMYTYTGAGRRQDNITDAWLNAVRQRTSADVSTLDVFHFVYAVLHHPEYRLLFGEALRKEFPRIPLPTGKTQFDALSQAGYALATLHVGFEQVKPWDLEWRESKDTPLDYRIEKMKRSADGGSLAVNDWLTLSGIPPQTDGYQLGNRSALDWVVDQYVVRRDPDGNVLQDPNRDDDAQYIVNLVSKVVRVSVETVQIVKSLPSLDLDASSDAAKPRLPT